jgi:hypothetical protein
MLVATNTGLDNNNNTNGFTNSFTDNRNFELLILDNLIVCRSAWI